MGVVAAFINFFGKELAGPQWSLNATAGLAHWTESVPAEALGFGMFALLLIFFAWSSMRRT